MSNKSWLQRLEAQVVIHVPDERDREVQDLAIRTGYIFASVAALGLSAYRELFTGQSGLIWPTALIVLLPLLFPLGRRLLSGGMVTTDERVRRIQTRAFRWAYLITAAGLLAYGMYRGVVLQDQDATWNLAGPVFVGGLAGFITQVGQNTVRAGSRGWLGSAFLFLCVMIPLAILLWVVAHSEMRGSISSMSFIIMNLLMGVILVSYLVISLFAAWRRRREERAEQEDERKSLE